MTLDFSVVANHWPVFWNGLLVTVLLAALSTIVGTALGIGLALAKQSKNKILQKITGAYCDFFRLIPLLVLLIWVYYALPIISGIRIGLFESALLTLSLQLSAYICELVRSGLETIPQGQIESARMAGLNQWQILQHITLPQAIRQLLSPLIGLYIENAKNTTFAAILALNELLHAGQVLSSITYRPLEIYTTIAVLFLITLFPLTLLAKRFEYSQFKQKLKEQSK